MGSAQPGTVNLSCNRNVAGLIVGVNVLINTISWRGIVALIQHVENLRVQSGRKSGSENGMFFLIKKDNTHHSRVGNRCDLKQTAQIIGDIILQGRFCRRINIAQRLNGIRDRKNVNVMSVIIKKKVDIIAGQLGRLVR